MSAGVIKMGNKLSAYTYNDETADINGAIVAMSKKAAERIASKELGHLYSAGNISLVGSDDDSFEYVGINKKNGISDFTM